MSKPSRRVIQGLLKLHYQVGSSTAKSKPFSPNERALCAFTSSNPVRFPRTCSSSSLLPNVSSSSINSAYQIPSKQCFLSLPSKSSSSSQVGLSHISQRVHLSSVSNFPIAKNPSHAFSSRCLEFVKPRGFSSGVRFFSFSTKEFRKTSGNFGKTVFEKPVGAVNDALARYREAFGLHVEGFWKRNYLFLLGAGGVVVCALLWRVMFGIANMFVGLSEGMAKFGFLALSAAVVAFAGLYIRSRLMINPDKVYRITMRKLNTSAAILEVLGAPLTGSDLRAYVMSGGGLKLKNFRPSMRSKRCFLIFPIRGSERKGLASVTVKKKNGQYDIKLLAVDVPMAAGPDQRLFLIGDEKEYRVAGGLVSLLRDPVVKAMAATKEFDELDQIEEEADAERELQEAEKRHREEIEKLEKGGS